MKKQRIFLVVERLPEPPEPREAYVCPCCEDRMIMKEEAREDQMWLAHYQRFHNMTVEQFYRIEDGIDS